ncbi:MAG: YggS family pyridoxal phosphate-dependent enzyme [Desulfobacula sp.]|nr:YggS family pyridoxal phosphate-dependent enzyme [Desulfobacula sp.]
MASIKENIKNIQSQITNAAADCGRNPESIQLIAVSKKKSVEKIIACIDAGGSHFGENYMQEAVQKIDTIGKNRATWHFIGHLQSNKAKIAVQYFDYIHTVDTVKLAREINKQAKKTNKIQSIFLQVNIGDENSKSGTNIDQAVELASLINVFENVSIQGLMCMPPFFDDPELARSYFKKLVIIRKEIDDQKFSNVTMAHLSMGMSNDFKVAIQEGSTMVRVGTSIFGKRD